MLIVTINCDTCNTFITFSESTKNRWIYYKKKKKENNYHYHGVLIKPTCVAALLTGYLTRVHSPVCRADQRSINKYLPNSIRHLVSHKRENSKQKLYIYRMHKQREILESSLPRWRCQRAEADLISRLSISYDPANWKSQRTDGRVRWPTSKEQRAQRFAEGISSATRGASAAGDVRPENANCCAGHKLQSNGWILAYLLWMRYSPHTQTHTHTHPNLPIKSNKLKLSQKTCQSQCPVHWQWCKNKHK